MKTLIHYLPVGLLFSYIILCFFRVPGIADSFIVVAIAGLYGFLMYVKEYRDIPMRKVSNEEKALRERISELQLAKEVQTLELDLARVVKKEKEVGNVNKTFRF